MRETIGRFEIHELPNLARIYFDPSAHRYCKTVNKSKAAVGGYSAARGSQLPGVSTISKYVDPPGDPLLYWAAGLDQVAIAELADADTAAERDLTWLTDPERIKARLKEAELSWAHVRDRAAARGTTAHEQGIAELAAGRVPDLAQFDESVRGYAQAVFRWWQDRQPVPIESERVTASLSLGFAGRFDLLCEVDGETWLIDAKTREKGRVRMGDFVQLEGYELANRECGIGKSDKRVALILMPDGSYREEMSVAEQSDFMAAINVYSSNKELARLMRAAQK